MNTFHSGTDMLKWPPTVTQLLRRNILNINTQMTLFIIIIFADISGATALCLQVAVPRIDVHEHCSKDDGFEIIIFYF